jgi:uncharacterized protein YqjF (DUF2071 family)
VIRVRRVDGGRGDREDPSSHVDGDADVLIARRTLPARGLGAAAGLSEVALRALAPRAGWRRQSDGLRQVGHRPYPPPQRPWLMGQTWERLLFAHWRLEPERLAALMPPELAPDTYGGAAWLGLTPFALTGLRLRGTPPLASASRFPEMNLRTYVSVEERPGIHFFSLDAGSRAVVKAARLTYRLPYVHARMTAGAQGDEVEYASRRDDGSAAFAADYAPRGTAFVARPGTLEHFLTERYCVYVVDDQRRILRGEIHHPPWKLQPATAALRQNCVAAAAGIALPDEPPLLHYSGRQDMLAWSLEPVR